MKLKYWLFIVLTTACIALLAMGDLFAQAGIKPANTVRAGQSGWQFLKINGDARLSAMGGIYTAIGKGDAASIFSNPASLVDVRDMDLSLSTMTWIADIGYQTVAYAKNLGAWGIVGISVVSVNYGDMAETINQEIPGENRTDAFITGNTFTAGDLAVGLSYARKVTDKLAIGGNVRYIHQKIAELSMNNVSIDFGTVYYTGFKSLRLSILARNFGPDVHMVGWSEDFQAEADDIRMPMDFRGGVAMDFFDTEGSSHRLTVAVEGDHPNDGKEKVHVGADYNFKGMLSLRAGYRFNYDSQGLTLGGGLKYSIGKFSGRFDYAYVDFSDLKQVHMFCIGLSL